MTKYVDDNAPMYPEDAAAMALPGDRTPKPVELSKESPVDAMPLAQVVDLFLRRSLVWQSHEADTRTYTKPHRDQAAGQRIAYADAADVLERVIRKHPETLERLEARLRESAKPA